MNVIPPLKYLKSVRNVLGTIDCDPASSEFGNSRVKALKYFTKETDGLKHYLNWNGNVYLNSPYSTGNLYKWSVALVYSYRDTEITTQAIQLIPNDTSTQYFKLLSQFLLCFVDHRIKFVNSDGKIISGSAEFGNIFVYMGENKQKFADEFSKWGTIMDRFNGHD